MMPIALEDLARQAIGGDRDALDRLVRALQGDVYGLALRMLWNREDAEDATQEILVRTVTRLAQFDFRSKLKTWVYRIAVNYILDVKKSPVEQMHLNFQRFADDLVEGLSSDGPADSERSLLVEEVKIGCTLGMLQCLDRPHRLAYVLGEILDLSGPESAEALGISTELFRKRLQHARYGDRSVYQGALWSRLGQRSLRLPSTCACGTSPRPRPSRCARIRRATVVISGDPRVRSPRRAGAMGASGPSHQSPPSVHGRFRTSHRPVFRLTA